MKLIVIIYHLQQILTTQYPITYGLLNPPLSNAEFHSTFRSARLDMEYLYQIYCWKNGMKVVPEQTGNFYFSSFGYFLPLDSAIAMYNRPDNKEFKDAGLFPLMANYIGDYVFININSKDKNRGKIYCYSPALFDIKPEIAFDNIEALFGMIEECYTQGVYKEDKKEGLIVDYDKEAVIIRKYSKAPYWK